MTFSGSPLSLDEVFNLLPHAHDGHALLRQVRWGSRPRCPYCGSMAQTAVKGTVRHHCNGCSTTFSATVGTPMHRSHVDLRRWFAAGSAYLDRRPMTVRQLAISVGVNKNTAARMLRMFNDAEPPAHRLILAVDDRLQQLLIRTREDQR